MTDSFRTILFYIIVNCCYFIFFYFFVCELFIINFFFLLFNLCGFFFFCYPLFLLVFFFFFLLYLPCFLLVLGDWAYRVICFVVYCYLFILFFFIYFYFILFYLFIYFFTFMDFLGLFFVSLTALGTSSLCLIVFPPGGCTGAPFRGLVSRGSKLYKWWFGKASGLIDIELMNMVPRKRLTMGWEDDTWAQSGVRLLLPPGWSWLDGLGDGVNCFVFFLIFWKSMVIDGWETCFVCCRGQWRPQVGRWIPQCFLEHYSCYDTDRTAEITDAPTS